MCGIAGIILKQRNTLSATNTALKMSQTIKHRGPDGEGLLAIGDTSCTPMATSNSPLFKTHNAPYIPRVSEPNPESNFAAFAHRRLSIIDLSDLGHQPMCDATKNIWITYNGELYNYTELKSELINLGHTFISESDTEVVITAYKQWGTSCVQKFNGMWAFCIYDQLKKIFFASRDRFGVKPFYYIDNDTCFAFASEQKALVKSGLIDARMNRKSVHDYLLNDELENSTSNFFDGISELWPGTNLIYHCNQSRVELQTYYQIEDHVSSIHDELSDKQLTELIKEKLYHAVNIRLRSDVEVGTCLSGGIDSSAIAGIMSQFTNKPIHCFTSVFKEGAINEEQYADLVCAKLNSKHFKTEPNVTEFENDIEQLIYALDAPIWDTSTYAQYRVMALARSQNIKVVLDGQGADELFAGYHHHFLAKWNQVIKENGWVKGLADINHSAKSIPQPLRFYLKQKTKQLLPTLTHDHFSLLNSSFTTSLPIKNVNHISNTLNEQLIDDMGAKRLKSFLRCEDRCGMWHSVESRTPFSDDIELIELLFSCNGKRKIQNGVSKYFLREACKDILPNEIYTRYDKVGFETPMRSWITSMEPKIIESIAQANFDFVNINHLKKNYRSNKPAHLKLLFKLYVLSKWQSVFTSVSV